MTVVLGSQFQGQAWVVFLQWTVLLLSLTVVAPEAFRQWRSQSAAFRRISIGLAIGASALCWLVLPVERFDALGHSATYAECFLGTRSPGPDGHWEAYVTYPPIRWLYWALGAVFGREDIRVLLAFNVFVRGVTVLVFAWMAAVLSRREAVGALAGLLLVMHPIHAFWAVALYNIAVPLAAATACLLMALLAWRGGGRWFWMAAAACGGTVAATRVEWGILLVPMSAFLLLSLGPRWGRSKEVFKLAFWAPGLVAGSVLAGLLFAGAGGLTSQGGYHGILGYLESMIRQAGFVQVLVPWDGIGLVVAAGGVGVWAHQEEVGWTPAAGMVGFVAIGYLGLTTFNDFAYRHALLPGLLLWVGGAMAVLAVWPASAGAAGRAAAVLASVGLLWIGGRSVVFLQEIAELFYGSEEITTPLLRQLSDVTLDPASLSDGSCYLITDDEVLWERGLAGSHFNLMDPGEAVIRYRHHEGCVVWLLDATQTRWDELGVKVRAEKLRYWFDWTPLGFVAFPHGLHAMAYRMSSPPWGVGEEDPVPATEFILNLEPSEGGSQGSKRLDSPP